MMSIFTKEHYVPEPMVEYRGILLKAGNQYMQPYLDPVHLAPKFRAWIDDIIEQGDIDLVSFTLTDVNFFGPPTPERLGFFKGHCQATEVRSGEPIVSNIVFGRGGCVACLVICTATIDGQPRKLIPLTEQIRLPSGGRRQEAMAGMLDASTREFRGPVVAELEQEFGIKITEGDPRLRRLPGRRAWPSPGGCDEAIEMFYLELDITPEQYADMSTRTYGTGPDEKIRIVFYDYDQFDEVLNEIGDFKAGEMWRRYQWMLRQNETTHVEL